jgi:hypothetical protein
VGDVAKSAEQLQANHTRGGDHESGEVGAHQIAPPKTWAASPAGKRYAAWGIASEYESNVNVELWN